VQVAGVVAHGQLTQLLDMAVEAVQQMVLLLVGQLLLVQQPTQDQALVLAPVGPALEQAAQADQVSLSSAT
tara:strand:- start:216 stop:428 length:213 start_codon:yes stop_codon:yes gene_type:complete